jgi:hypothetical protein
MSQRYLPATMTSQETRSIAEFYTVRDVATRWKMSQDFVRDIFRDHPDVMRFPRPETRAKRGYVTIRIPHRTLVQVEANHMRLRPRLN